MAWWFFKKREVTGEERSKVRLRCEEAMWYVEVKDSVEGIEYWRFVFSSEFEAEAREQLQEWRHKVYFIHNGTVEYW